MESVMRAGACFCGAVRFEVTGEGGNPHSCSCRNCQQHTGAPTLALLVGSFDDPGQAAFAPEYHSFEDRTPHWWLVATAADDEGHLVCSRDTAPE